MLKFQTQNTLEYFGKFSCIQMKSYPPTKISPKYGVFYSNNDVRVQTLGLVLWLDKVLKTKNTFFGKF